METILIERADTSYDIFETIIFTDIYFINAN